jgi:hypothetical protein
VGIFTKKISMKTFLISILIFLTFTTHLFSQTIDDLDKKNGFKDFSLGDDFSKWKSQLVFISDLEDNSKFYLYKGTCCNMLFDYPIEQLFLRFEDNKLVEIYIETAKFREDYKDSGVYNPWRKDDYERINKFFIGLFGQPNGYNYSSSEFTFFWTGKKVQLRSTYENKGITQGDRQIVSILEHTSEIKGF